MYIQRRLRKQEEMCMKDGTEAQIRKALTVEIEALEKRYRTLKDYLAGAQMENFEAAGALQAYKDDLSLISAHILTSTS